MTLPLAYPYPPMEANSADTLPAGDAWLYEPKWDGFRSLAFKDKDGVRIQSRRFRHGTKFLRWRPDKAPEQCTAEQLRT